VDLEFLNSHPPLTRDEIAQAERQIGVRLPSDYVEFLLKQNPGV
jgi:hypothetical protein